MCGVDAQRSVCVEVMIGRGQEGADWQAGAHWHSVRHVQVGSGAGSGFSSVTFLDRPKWLPGGRGWVRRRARGGDK